MRSSTCLLALAALAGCVTEQPPGPDDTPARVCEAPATLDDPLGDPEVCASFEVPEPGPALEVGFINRRDEDIVLVGLSCQDTYFFAFGHPGGRAAQWPYSCHADPPPCEWLVAGEGGCLANCPTLPPIRLASGARFTTSWTPQLRIETEIPGACTADLDHSSACMALRRPTPSAYLLQALVVDPDACGEACDCDPGEQGWCEGTVDPPIQTETVELLHVPYDGVCTAVDFVVEPLAPPSAG